MRAELFWISDIAKGRLTVMPRPRGGDWLEEEVKSLRSAGVHALVCLLTAEEMAELDLADEAELCVAQGIQFIGFPILDRSVPASSQETLAVVRQLTALLEQGKAVGIHCRQGVGRSALIAACVIVALGDHPDTAFEWIERARGCPVPDTMEQREWVQKFAGNYLKHSGRVQ